ncbi:hypothetical protein K8I28_03940, partial [bacterium]|nr:hypothetical protein [bacterium]
SQRINGTPWTGFSAPPPAKEERHAEHFLAILDEGLDNDMRENELRVQNGLRPHPMKRSQMMDWDEVAELGITDILALLLLNGETQIEHLKEIFLQDKRSWQAAVAERILMERVLELATDTENPNIFPAVEVMRYGFSPVVLSQVAEFLKTSSDSALVDALDGLLYGLNLYGEPAKIYQNSWYVFDILLSRDIPESHLFATQAVAANLLQGKQIHPNLLALYSEKCNLGSVEQSLLANSLHISIQKKTQWEIGQLSELLNLGSLVNEEDAARILDEVAVVLKEGRFTGEVRSLESPIYRIAMQAGKNATAILKEMVEEQEYRAAGVSEIALEALSLTADPDAAKALIHYSSTGIYEERSLKTLAEMDLKLAEDFAFQRALIEVNAILSGSVDYSHPVEMKSGSALNSLAKKADRLPHVEVLILRFVAEAPPIFKKFAQNILFYMPTEKAAEMVFKIIPNLPVKEFPADLEVVSSLPRSVLNSWLEMVVYGQVDLPAFEEREESYVRSAIRLLTQDETLESTLILQRIMENVNGVYAIAVLAELEKRDAFPPVLDLAVQIFRPREGWNSNLLGIVASSKQFGKMKRIQFYRAGAEVVEENLQYYSELQLLRMAGIIANFEHPDEITEMAEVLTNSDNRTVASLAGFARDRAGLSY